MPKTETYIIHINQLRFHTLVGIYTHEQETKQPLIIDLEIGVKIPPDYLDKHVDYESVYCYHSLIKKIETYIDNQQQIDLLENLARDIAELAFDDKRVKHIKVHAKKTDAIEMAQDVGVCLHFSQDI